jgi:membrane protein insertase Oxa1/YidC/SpoIIIJ
VFPLLTNFVNFVEGAFWFKDLTAADPYCILPACLSGAILLHFHLVAKETKQPLFLQYIFRGISGIMFFATAFQPAVSDFKIQFRKFHKDSGTNYIFFVEQLITLYWTGSNICTLLVGIAFHNPAIRKYLNIPPPVINNAPAQSWKEIMQQAQAKRDGIIAQRAEEAKRAEEATRDKANLKTPEHKKRK